MLSFAGSLRIFIALDPCDMRAGVNTLHALVGDRLKEDSRSGTLFVFTNRTRRQCRILVWERSGFVMWQKKLERERFAWPKRTDAVVSMSGTELNLLLDGYDIWRVEPHQTLHYASMY